MQHRNSSNGFDKLAMYPPPPPPVLEALSSLWSVKCACQKVCFKDALCPSISRCADLQKFVFYQPKQKLTLIISAVNPVYAYLFSSILTFDDFVGNTKNNWEVIHRYGGIAGLQPRLSSECTCCVMEAKGSLLSGWFEWWLPLPNFLRSKGSQPKHASELPGGSVKTTNHGALPLESLIQQVYGGVQNVHV